MYLMDWRSPSLTGDHVAIPVSGRAVSTDPADGSCCNGKLQTLPDLGQLTDGRLCLTLHTPSSLLTPGKIMVAAHIPLLPIQL